MLVPLEVFTDSWLFSSEAAMKMQLPSSSSSCFVFNSTSATEAMDGRASPRKPRVCMLNKSWAEDILEVACLSKAIRASMGDMPFPSSMT